MNRLSWAPSVGPRTPGPAAAFPRRPLHDGMAPGGGRHPGHRLENMCREPRKFQDHGSSTDVHAALEGRAPPAPGLLCHYSLNVQYDNSSHSTHSALGTVGDPEMSPHAEGTRRSRASGTCLQWGVSTTQSGVRGSGPGPTDTKTPMHPPRSLRHPPFLMRAQATRFHWNKDQRARPHARRDSPGLSAIPCGGRTCVNIKAHVSSTRHAYASPCPASHTAGRRASWLHAVACHVTTAPRETPSAPGACCTCNVSTATPVGVPPVTKASSSARNC